MSSAALATGTGTVATAAPPQSSTTSTYDQPDICIPPSSEAKDYRFNCYFNLGNDTLGNPFPESARTEFDPIAKRCCAGVNGTVSGGELHFVDGCGFACVTKNDTLQMYSLQQGWVHCINTYQPKNWSYTSAFDCHDEKTKKSDASRSASLKAGLVWAILLGAAALAAA